MGDGRIRRRGFLATAGATVAGVGGLLAGPHAEAAADPRLTVGPIRRVGADGSKYFEPWIAANPRDASNLVIVGSRDLIEATTVPFPHGTGRLVQRWTEVPPGRRANSRAGPICRGSGRSSPMPTRPTRPTGRLSVSSWAAPRGTERPLDLPLRRRWPTLAGADDRARFP